MGEVASRRDEARVRPSGRASVAAVAQPQAAAPAAIRGRFVAAPHPTARERLHADNDCEDGGRCFGHGRRRRVILVSGTARVGDDGDNDGDDDGCVPVAAGDVGGVALPCRADGDDDCEGRGQRQRRQTRSRPRC
eukprot:5525679-Pleurochrysis_carterae.AAC.1